MEGDLRGAGQSDHILHGVPTHNGYYVNYNVLGDNFEVSAKYVLPLWPILKGSYGLVCAAVNSETGEKVAIKKIKDAFVNRINAKRVLREIKLLQQMDHENIIVIMDIIQPPRREEFNDIYIVYELMEADLHHVIHSREMLTEDYCQFFLYNLLRGLKYMHSANVVHRDLKPSNLFINSNDEFKIGDFGLAWTTTETDSMTEYAVTQWYHPPELLLNCPEYTAAIDIWSVGCIFMEILTRKTILPGRDYVQQLHLIMELVGSPEENDLNFLKSENSRRYINQLPKYTSVPLSQRFPDVNPQAIDLVNRMLVFNPSKRITVTDALDHSYLAALHDIEDEPTCDTPFDFEFEKASITEDQMRELIWQESLSFNSCP